MYFRRSARRMPLVPGCDMGDPLSLPSSVEVGITKENAVFPQILKHRPLHLLGQNFIKFPDFLVADVARMPMRPGIEAVRGNSPAECAGLPEPADILADVLRSQRF